MMIIRHDRSRPATLAGVVAVCLLAIGGCAKKGGDAGGAAGGGGFEMPPMPVETAVAASQTVSDRFKAVGSVEAGEAITVVSEIDGTITSLPFREGESIAAPLKETGVVTDMVVNMVDVGEETGDLDTMLYKIADNYDEEVDVLVEGLVSMLEPLMIVFLGLTIGFIVIALFMPLIKLLNELGKNKG